MATVQNVLDRGRIPLNDKRKVRYPDTELLAYLNDGIALAYQLRPDLRFGGYGEPVKLLVLSDTFPLGPQHEVALQHYILFRAENKHDEHVNANREVKSYQMFEAGVLKS